MKILTTKQALVLTSLSIASTTLMAAAPNKLMQYLGNQEKAPYTWGADINEFNYGKQKNVNVQLSHPISQTLAVEAGLELGREADHILPRFDKKTGNLGLRLIDLLPLGDKVNLYAAAGANLFMNNEVTASTKSEQVNLYAAVGASYKLHENVGVNMRLSHSPFLPTTHWHDKTNASVGISLYY